MTFRTTENIDYWSLKTFDYDAFGRPIEEITDSPIGGERDQILRWTWSDDGRPLTKYELTRSRRFYGGPRYLHLRYIYHCNRP